MKEIRLTQGYIALVDDEDFEKLSEYKWCAHVGKKSGGRVLVYAKRSNGITMHQQLLPDAKGVDHRDGDGLNNQRSNLRPATQAQNSANKRKQLSATSSRFKGVCWHKPAKKWMAYIRHNGKLHNLGLFTEEVDAAQAYNFAASELFGEFARLNEPLAA